ncbi:glycosyltransferase family A protein [Cellulomonas sp. NS3]|uniref:glycosyltransferase family A protein n=1 Tax=Cellulomonas sp. NS3 TaxID=2973977 RepID=UPI002162E503|nr:glycosyltransferase family A protein [Cellulomonas sp. NS3]
MPVLTLSVVIPVKDDAVALRACLTHLDRQTRPAWEVVVVDNGSTDDSAAVAVAHGARVVPESAPGIPAAAAAGYDAARGDVIVRCDADTLVPPDWLASVARHFEDDPALDAVTGTGTFYDVPRWRATVVGWLYLRTYYAAMHAAMAHPPLWGSNMALRRTSWVAVRERVNRADPESHDDVDLSFALGPGARLRYDRRLRVRVSGRSLHGAAQVRRRFDRAWRSLRRGWDVQPPWERWAQRLGGGPGRGGTERGETGRAGGRRATG